MAQLAIKGHSTRGSEVIALLEMLGGINHFHIDGFTEEYIYYICEENNQIHSAICPTNQIVFTIEKFLEKYPYKIGDKVDYIKYDDEEFSVYEIKGMVWTGTTIEYTLDSFGFTCLTKDIRLHKEKNKNKKFKSLNVETYLKVWDETENGLEVVVNDNFELKEDNGKFYIIKKQPKYPKTYEECCRIVNADPYIRLKYDLSDGQKYSYDVDNLQHYENIRKLLICRDAYWKIAGEQIGLGKPWEPNWSLRDTKYIIVNRADVPRLNEVDHYSRVLAFPTREMRDAFYESFKEFIEICKELL